MIFVLLACTQDVQVEYGQEGCTDYDFSGTQESVLETTWVDGSTAKVARLYDVQPMTSLVFEPDIVGSGATVDLTEAWTGGVDDSEFCYQPYVLVSGITSGVELQWFDGDPDVPFGVVDLQPD